MLDVVEGFLLAVQRSGSPVIVPTYLGQLASAAALDATCNRPVAMHTLATCDEYCAQQYLQADLVREIFGNPYWRPTADRRWLTSACRDLARFIDRGNHFDRLPMLADAMIDAGCDDERLIAHCHSRDRHARGCWVVDLFLDTKRLA